jgi:hypothetical protein
MINYIKKYKFNLIPDRAYFAFTKASSGDLNTNRMILIFKVKLQLKRSRKSKKEE